MPSLRMLRLPTVKFFAQSMAVPHGEHDLTHAHFYALQSGKLKALLDTVVDEARGVVDPQTCLDYLELTGLLTEMLDEAQHYAVLSRDELGAREAQIGFFLAKVDAVRGTIADWDQRTRRVRNVSRKRTRRSVDVGAEMMMASTTKTKRRRDDEDDDTAMIANAVYNAPFPQAWPAMDLDSSPSPTPWWSQPYCD